MIQFYFQIEIVHAKANRQVCSLDGVSNFVVTILRNSSLQERAVHHMRGMHAYIFPQYMHKQRKL